MNYQRALSALMAHAEIALTVVVLARILETSERNIDYWIARHGLPKPFYQPPDRQRYWHPAEVSAWVMHRQRLSREAIGFDEIRKRTGLTAQRWRQQVQAKRAPKAIAHELGTGRKLWWVSDVDAFMLHTNGGVRMPSRKRKHAT